MQEKFAPTLDWGNELWTSLIWVAKGWAIAAAVTLIILVLLGRYTTWGRQFWRITGAYFTGAESIKVWVWLGVLLLLVVAGVRLDVLFTYQSSDMLTAFQAVAAGIATGDEAVKESGKGGFWLSLGIFSILAAIYIVRLLLDLFLWQRFCLAWRAWLTDRLTGDWLDGKAYYRARFIIGQDRQSRPTHPVRHRHLHRQQRAAAQRSVYGHREHASFRRDQCRDLGDFLYAILWDLSGPMTLPLIGFELPRAMFCIGIVFVLVVSVIAFWLGRPIIWLSFANEKFNAAFRYALVRLRDASEAVAFYRGEVVERTGLRKLFAPVVDNYKRYLARSVLFNGWNWSMGQLIVPLPYMLQFPRFYSGEITLGAMSQSSQAFSQIQTGLSWFRNAYDLFAGYRAAIIRLEGLVTANEEGRALPEITTTPCVDGTVQLDDIEVRTPDGKQLVKPLDLRLEVGDTLVVTGKSGTGKTTLLRSLAELWPFTTGTLTRPCGPNETMFLSQLPYVPLGDLRAVVTYPNLEGSIDDETLDAHAREGGAGAPGAEARRGAGLGQGALTG